MLYNNQSIHKHSTLVGKNHFCYKYLILKLKNVTTLI